MSVPALIDTKYKAKSYGLFIIMLLVLFALIFTGFIMVDHSLKSDQPLTGFFVKSQAEYLSENKRLTHEVDSLKAIASQVPILKRALKNSSSTAVTTNVQVPNLGHYRDTKNLKAKDYQAYLVEKMRFYYRKSEVQEKFIKDNF